MASAFRQVVRVHPVARRKELIDERLRALPPSGVIRRRPSSSTCPPRWRRARGPPSRAPRVPSSSPRWSRGSSARAAWSRTACRGRRRSRSVRGSPRADSEIDAPRKQVVEVRQPAARAEPADVVDALGRRPLDLAMGVRSKRYDSRRFHGRNSSRTSVRGRVVDLERVRLARGAVAAKLRRMRRRSRQRRAAAQLGEVLVA